jgi:hypothetical protein
MDKGEAMLAAITSDVARSPDRMVIVMREWGRSFESVLEGVHTDMRELSVTSKQVGGKQFYIECFDKRAQNNGFALRWRKVDANGHKHILWVDVNRHLVNMPKTMSDWYIKLNNDIEWLNTVEKTMRGLIKQTSRFAK